MTIWKEEIFMRFSIIRLLMKSVCKMQWKKIYSVLFTILELTIFMEYQIVFIGYSISDSDIQEILGDVVECLPPEKVNSLQKRFIFIDYQKDTNDCEVSSHSLVINGKLIEMTKIILSDFGILYDALSEKKLHFQLSYLDALKINYILLH